MKCFRRLFLLALLIQSLIATATPKDFNPNYLPAPAWVNAVEITSSSIEINWASVSGAHHYKVSRFDVTHSVQLPDVFPTEPEFLSTPHDQGTTILFEVSAVDENDVAWTPTGAEFTTTIIVVDLIASFTAPTAPNIGKPIAPGASGTEVTLIDGDKHAATIGVLRTKVQYVDAHNDLHSAEFLLWSSCSTGEENAASVMYWNESSWPASVDYVENHAENWPEEGPGPITSVTFRINQGAFFTLFQPNFSLGLNGEPNHVGLKIRNDLASNIYFGYCTNTENNPCYVPPMVRANGPTTLASDEEQEIQDRAALEKRLEVGALSIHPNPFSESFNVNYTLDQESPVTLILFDHTGHQLKTMQLPTLAAGEYNTSIYTNDLPAGIYQLGFQTNQTHRMTTLVKHR